MPPSRGLALLTAFTNFVYQTLDAVDGKQARRTGASSPLGQLFDHGCDCLACIGQHSIAMMVLLPGPTVWPVATLASLQTGFFMLQWHERHAHWLPTALGPVGVTELQLVWILWAIGAAVAGPERMSAFASTKVYAPWSGDVMPLGHLVIVMWLCCLTVLIIICTVSTLRKARAASGLPGMLEAVSQLLPVLVLDVCLLTVWDPSAYRLFPRKLCLLTGMRFFFFTAQVILYSMARMPFPVMQLPTLLTYVGLAMASRHLQAEQLDRALTIDAVMVSLWVLHWLLIVIDELGMKLNIYAFSLRKREGSPKQE